jgi:SAM-dependent methyltransferase
MVERASLKTDPMTIVSRSPESRRRARRVFVNGEMHGWYRLVPGYSDQVVTFLLDRLKIRRDRTVLDPFCGTGTTLVECMKRGIASVGVDANPSSCFAARVKTDWELSPATLLTHLGRIKKLSRYYLGRPNALQGDR